MLIFLRVTLSSKSSIKKKVSQKSPRSICKTSSGWWFGYHVGAGGGPATQLIPRHFLFLPLFKKKKGLLDHI